MRRPSRFATLDRFTNISWSHMSCSSWKHEHMRIYEALKGSKYPQAVGAISGATALVAVAPEIANFKKRSRALSELPQ